jgi:hypothetical protein
MHKENEKEEEELLDVLANLEEFAITQQSALTVLSDHYLHSAM